MKNSGMKGNLFIQLAGVSTKVEFDQIINEQNNYEVLSDWFAELFRGGQKVILQPKITELLGILDLWNYAHEAERKFWTLKDAAHPLQQIEIPIRNFIKTFAQKVGKQNWELAKGNIDSLSTIVNTCTFQDACEYDNELNDNDYSDEEDRQRNLLLRLAGLSYGFSTKKDKKEGLALQELGKTFAKLFLKLGKQFDFGKVRDEKYELFNCQRDGFLAFKTLVELGFTNDLAHKILDHDLALTEQDKSQKVLQLFEHPKVLSPKELERLYKVVESGKKLNQAVSSTALAAGVPETTPPQVKPGPLSCAFLGENVGKGHHR